LTTSEARSILILRLSALGDIIHTLPSVVALRDAYPSAKLGWVVEQPFAELVRTVAPVDEVFPVATRRWRKSPLSSLTRSEARQFLRAIRNFSKGQTSIDFQGLLKSAVLARLSGTRHRYGFATDSVRERAAAFLYNHSVSADRIRHVVEWNLQLARAAGASAPVPPSVRERCLRFAAGSAVLESLMTSGTVVLNPGAGRPSKLWGVERFAELARRIREELRLDPLIVWGPGEEKEAGEIARRSSSRLAPPTSLGQLSFVLSRAPLLISGDSGPLHLAAAMEIPVVGLFGPTSPARNGPWGELDHVVESYTTTRSMSTITVDAVFQKVREVWR